MNKKILKYNDFRLILEAEGDEDLEDFGGDETTDEGGEDFGGDEMTDGEEGGEENVFQEVPEKIIDQALKMLKKNIEELFEEKDEVPTKGIKEVGDEGFGDKIKDKSNKGKELSFEEMGVKLMRINLNSYSRTNRSLDLRFGDSEGNMYSLYIRVDLDEAIPEKGDMEIEPKMVKNAFMKFKKYDVNNDLEDSISRNIDDMWVVGSDEQFLIDLKLEIDGGSSNEEDELVIET